MSTTTPLLRRVPRGRWVAVVRRDVVQRVRTAGTTWRLPFLERFAEDADEPVVLPLHARARTRDGVSVSVAGRCNFSSVASSRAAIAGSWRRSSASDAGDSPPSASATEHSTFSDCSRFFTSCVTRAPVSCTASM